MEEREGGPNRSGRLARRAKIIRRQTIAVVWCAGIMDDVEGVRYGKEVRCPNHPGRNTRAEFLDLTADVSEECIAAPSAD